MRVKFEIDSDNQVNNIDSDYDGKEYIKVTKVDDKLVVIVTVPLTEIDYGGIH